MGKELLRPINDYVCKSIFYKNIPILKAFLVAVLGLPYEELDGLTVIDPVLTPDHIRGKKAVLDLKARTKAGKVIHIEVQRRNQQALWKRFMFYGAKMVVEQGRSGAGYNNINQVISIILTDFVMVDESEAWHHRLHLNDPVTGAVLLEGLEIHLLELPKIQEPDGTPLGNWMMFFNSITMEQLMTIAQSDPAIREAAGTVIKLSGDDRDREVALRMEMARMDAMALAASERNEGRDEGIVEGIERGKQEEKFATARNMLQDKIEHAVIARWTGLSPGEINKLAAELGVN